MSSTFLRSGKARWAGLASALLLAAGGTTVAVATGSDSDSAPRASASTSAPAKASADKGTVTKGQLQPGDALSSHNFRLRMDGAPVENLQEVSGLEDQKVTLVRGATHSAEVDRWIEAATEDREGRLKDVTLELLDYQDGTVKQYHLKGAFVERIDRPATPNPDTPGAETLTVRFFTLTIE
ncbi:MAG: hypothetical protein WCD21_08540 [Streptomyces sp.]